MEFTLLFDAGIFTYTDQDPYRQYGLSTRAHNTVEINDRSQARTFGPGPVYDWFTNDRFDFLSEATGKNSGFEHIRNITFVKPDFWIVSDTIEPEDAQKQNSYKQLWHMLPNANFTMDEENLTVRSGYASRTNILVASADQGEARLVRETGYYDMNYQQIEEADYSYFQKSGVAGKVTFDTVLLPYHGDNDASIDVERLDTGVVPSVATALRFRSTVNQVQRTTSYYLSHEDQPGAGRSFGNYTTDGKMVVVGEDSQGNLEQLILKDASVIESAADGGTLIRYPEPLDDLAVQWIGSRLEITVSATDENIPPQDIRWSDMRIGAAGEIRSLTINGRNAAFSVEDGMIIPSDREAEKMAVAITSPSAVRDVPNGTEKTAKALGLPETVTLVTDMDDVQADVIWDLESCDYDPSDVAEQSFEVNGTVILPDGVANPNDISAVQVTVLAAASPAAEDMIFAGGGLSLAGSSRIIGNTGTNATEAGSVEFAWSSGIEGDLWIGPEGDWTEVVSGKRPDPRENITGEIAALPSVREYLLPEFPEFPDLDEKGDLTAGWTQKSPYDNAIEESGAYGKIDVTNELVINVGEEDIEIKVDRLSVTGSGKILVNRTGSGRLILYVTDGLVLAGNGKINPGGNREDVRIYYAGGEALTFGGNTAMAGSLFAGTADISLTNAGGITGHIVTGGSAVNLSGNARVNDGIIYAPDASLTASGSCSVQGGAIVRRLELSGSARILFDDSTDPGCFEQPE